MYEQHFSKAKIWSVLWRVILASIGVVIVTSILLVAFQYQYFDFLNMVGSLVLYFLIYKITISQIHKQNFSLLAITDRGNLDKKALYPILLLTVITAVCGSLFLYVVLRLAYFSQPLYYELVLFFGFIPGLADESATSSLYLLPIAVIAAPIVEELTFRGFLLNKWAAKYGNIKGIIFSSIIFMMIHLGSLLIPQLLLGLLCSLIYIKTKKIIYPIITHMLYNFLIIVPSLFSSNLSESEILEMVYPSQSTLENFTLYTVVFVVLLVVLLIGLVRYGKGIRQEQAPYRYNLEKRHLADVSYETIQQKDQHFDDFDDF